MNEVLKTIKERSSIRAYTDEKLTKEEINAVITAAHKHRPLEICRRFMFRSWTVTIRY